MKARVSFLPAWSDACALYRMFMPHLYIPHAKYVFRHGPVPWDDVSDSNIGVVQRLGTRDNQMALEGMKSRGLKVVYDLDDDLWSIQGANPAKKKLKSVQDGFEVCAEMCDVITVSTQPLKTAAQTSMKGLKKEIVVIENAIDFNLFRNPGAIEKDEDKVVIGWGGSNTHGADILAVWDILPELLKEEPKLYMVFIGMLPPPSLYDARRAKSLHPRVIAREWVPVEEYPARFTSWNWDVVIAPLDDSRFNRSKSCIKMLEAATINAPCLVSAVRPYEDFCAKANGELDFLLCQGKSSWKSKIKTLINEPELRKTLGEKMNATTKEFYDVKKNIGKITDLLEGLVA